MILWNLISIQGPTGMDQAMAAGVVARSVLPSIGRDRNFTLDLSIYSLESISIHGRDLGG